MPLWITAIAAAALIKFFSPFPINDANKSALEASSSINTPDATPCALASDETDSTKSNDNCLEPFVNGLNNDTKFATFSAETPVFLDTLAKSTENLALATLTSPKVLAIASNELLTCSADNAKNLALILDNFNCAAIALFAFKPPPKPS